METPDRIEPARLSAVPDGITDLVAELSAQSAILSVRLHPMTAASLADLVRNMNCYYSNLIEGHNTRPRDIERALVGDFSKDKQRHLLQIEAAAHIRVQKLLDQQFVEDKLPEPASMAFIRGLHKAFYHHATPEMLTIKGRHDAYLMRPGEWRTRSEQDNAVGLHLPPGSAHVENFMAYFEQRYRFKNMGTGNRILAMASAHHRFNYIHPFPDGNGRVSRLMSHAMGLQASVGAHGLWSVSRGLARGVESRADYRTKMSETDTLRQGDLDGRGNLSERALVGFIDWFLGVCIDQVEFMSRLFDLENLGRRMSRYVEYNDALKPQANALLQEALLRGQIDRGASAQITGLPERSARRVLNGVIEDGLLASRTPKGPVSIAFPAHTVERLFPGLYPET
jgi:Fic family protein